MSNSPARLRRLSLVEAQVDRAEQLLALAKGSLLEEQIGLATIDLVEAVTLLRDETIEAQSHALGVVDTAIRVASCRLDLVAAALRPGGPWFTPSAHMSEG